MNHQEHSNPAQQRPRVVLRLVPPLPAEPGPLPGPAPVLDMQGLRLTREQLDAGGQTFPLKELTGFRTRRQAPRLSLPLLMGSMSVMLAVPVLLGRPGSALVYAALALIVAGVFASLLYLMRARDTYGLVLRTRRGDLEVFRTQDTECFSRVVEALDRMLVRRLPEGMPRLVLVR